MVNDITLRFVGEYLVFEHEDKRVSYVNEERLQADSLTGVANTLGVDHKGILKLLC